MMSEALQALVENSTQSALAVVEAVKTLKEEREKAKGAGFGSASKVQKQPEPIAPSNQEQEITMFQNRVDFRRMAKKDLDEAEKSDRTMDFVKMRTVRTEQSSYIASWLGCCAIDLSRTFEQWKAGMDWRHGGSCQDT